MSFSFSFPLYILDWSLVDDALIFLMRAEGHYAIPDPPGAGVLMPVP